MSYINIELLPDKEVQNIFNKSKKLNYKPHCVRYISHRNKYEFLRWKDVVKRNYTKDCYLFDDILNRLDIKEQQRKILWK